MYGENAFFESYKKFIVQEYRDNAELSIYFGYGDKNGVIIQVRKLSPPVCRRHLYTYFKEHVTAVIKEYLATHKGSEFRYVLFSER